MLYAPYGSGVATYLGGHDDFVIGLTQDRYYLAPDVHQKCEDLRSNQPLFLVFSVHHCGVIWSPPEHGVNNLLTTCGPQHVRPAG